jgi:hypothetical protein
MPGFYPIGAVDFNSSTTTADATTGMTVKAGVANKVIYVTDMMISTDTAMDIELHDTDNTVIFEHMYFPSKSIWSKTWSTPIAITLGKGLKVVSSVAGNVTSTITGFTK